ncbi:MAG: hypothetical protein IPP46_05925 [Bacteroidetes bacterium]|nr:hypothetical protein [Bacteroidota bacterium]
MVAWLIAVIPANIIESGNKIALTAGVRCALAITGIIKKANNLNKVFMFKAQVLYDILLLKMGLRSC